MKAILLRIEKLLIALLQESQQEREPLQVAAEVWLTKRGVMDLLCITESTFYRRLSECDWVRKKSGREWYYLKSSIF